MAHVIGAFVVGTLVATVPSLSSNNLLPRSIAMHLLAVVCLFAGWRSRGRIQLPWLWLLADLIVLKVTSPWRAASVSGFLEACALISVAVGLASARVPVRSVLVLPLVAIFLGAVFGLAEQWLPVGWGDATRPAGFFATRVTAAALMVAALPLNWLLLRRRHAVLFVGTVAIECAFLFSTRTRAAWVAAALVLAAMVALLPRSRRPLLAGLVLAGALAALTPGPLLRWASPTPYADSLADIGTLRVGDRLAVWREALALTATHPWGRGAGTFEASFAAATSSLPKSLDEVRIESPHNEGIRLAYELGVPGLVLLVMALWARGRRVGPARRMVLLSLAGLAVCSMTGKTFVEPPTAALAAVLLGVATRPRMRGRSSRPWLWGSLAAAMLALAVVVDAPACSASRALASAKRLAAQGDVRVALEMATPSLGANNDLGAWLWAIDVMSAAGDRRRCRQTCAQALGTFPEHPALLLRQSRCGTGG